MADYGELTEVVSETRSANLASDAAVSDTELEVDDAGDFNASSAENPDGGGGTLLLNGATLAYTDITWGTTEDDTDLILLAEPLAVAADEGDSVTTLVGGLPAEDWYAVVDMGEGDNVKIPLTFAQRAQWPLGPYELVPVQVSDDHERLEDAPGRPASAGSRIERWVDDEWTAAGDATDSPGTLTYTPKPHSLTVQQNGLRLRNSDFTLSGRVVTPLASALKIKATDLFMADYDYDPAAETVGQGSNANPLVEALQALGPIWLGIEDDVSGVAISDYSGFSRDGIYNNGVSLGASQIVPALGDRGCADYDGIDDFGQTPVASWLNTTQIAVLAWIKPDVVGSTIRTICGRNNLAGVATFGLWITTGGKLHFEANTTTGTQQITGATTLTAGNEYMVAGIFNGSTVQVLLNGAADAAPVAASGVLNTSIVYPAQVGALGTGVTLTDFFNGRMGPVGLYDPSAHPITAADIANLYALGQVAA